MREQITRTLTREQLLDVWVVLDDPISDEIVGKSRWSVEHEVIFKAPDDGKFYRANYSRGATEEQSESPWQDEPTVEATEVHQVEKIVKVWEPLTAEKGVT